MDPLSFTASIITVVAVAKTLAKHLEELRGTLQDAPDILSSLVNEISDLRIVLEACNTAVNESYNGSTRTNPVTPLADAAQVLHRTRGLLEDLDKLVSSCLRETSDASGGFKTARFRWLRVSSKTEKIQQRLRDSKQDLLMLLESQSASTLSGMQLTVQDVSVGVGQYHSASMERMDQILGNLSKHMVQIQELRSVTADLSGKIASLELSHTAASLSSTKSPSFDEGHPAENTAGGIAATTSSLQIRASCYRKTCRPWCSCRCHIRRAVRTPALAKKFIGSLFVGYSGMPAITEPCNERQCRKRSSSRIILSYQFPEWFWARSLLASFMAASVAGPEMLIRVANTIPFASETYQHCLNGNGPGLLRLFETGNASPFDLDPDGVSLLRNALRFNQLEMCRLLICQGSDLYQEDHTGFSAYHFAWDGILFDPLEPWASKRKQALLELFPQEEGGLDERQFSRIHKSVLGLIGTPLKDELSTSTSAIDDVDNLGRTPLFWAARREDSHAVKLLLEYGARCEPPGMCKGESPLLAAARAANEDITRLLLEHTINVATRCESNETPLHYAASKPSGNGCVKLLIQAGADVNCEDLENRTPLHVAAQNGCIEIVETLLAAGANINCLCEDGWTPLACCVFWNVHQSIDLLLDHGADTLITTDQGESLLHLAAHYADEHTLRVLAVRDLGPLAVEAKTTAGEEVYGIAKEREESTEWNIAFDNLINSIQKRELERLGRNGADLRVDEAIEDIATKLTIRPAQESHILVRVEEFSDEDSICDQFEDALELLA